MAFWGMEIKPKKPLPLSIERRLVVKQAALVIDRSSSSDPCVLSVSVEGSDQQFVVCRLHEGRLEHCTLELPFSPTDSATLHLKGPHAVHLTGFLELEDEDDFDEMDEAAANGLGGGADDDDEDDDEDDDDDYDGLDDDDDMDDDGFDDEEDDEDDEEDDEEEDDDDDDDDEEDDEVVVAPPTKKAKQEAPPKAKQQEPPTASTKKKGAASAAAAAPVKPDTQQSSAGAPNTWTKDEESKFKKALQTYPEGSEKRWEKVAAVVGSRSKDQCKKKFTQDKKAAK